jgi:hypothetical protein
MYRPTRGWVAAASCRDAACHKVHLLQLPWCYLLPSKLASMHGVQRGYENLRAIVVLKILGDAAGNPAIRRVSKDRCSCACERCACVAAFASKHFAAGGNLHSLLITGGRIWKGCHHMPTLQSPHPSPSAVVEAVSVTTIPFPEIVHEYRFVSTVP